MKFKNIIIVFIVFIIGFSFGFILKNKNKLNETEKTINNVIDSVVSIQAYDNNRLMINGSGFIYKMDKKAYIITNNHVIEDYEDIKVIMNNGKKIEAEIIGKDIYSDIALLSIDKKYAKSKLKLGNSDKLKLGQEILSIGTPIDNKYLNTITKGIVSGLNRKIKVTISRDKQLINTIQTDAAINEGNSGGPLINLKGEVVGINSMKLEQIDVESMSFAIPINEVKDIINKLEKGIEIKKPSIGLELVNIDNINKLIENYISIDESIKYGVVITDVYKNSSAYKNGLKIGDIIIGVDDNKIEDMYYFKYYFYKHNAKDKIKIKYIRNNQEQTIYLRLN